jgi:hypothetical protein
MIISVPMEEIMLKGQSVPSTRQSIYLYLFEPMALGNLNNLSRLHIITESSNPDISNLEP